MCPSVTLEGLKKTGGDRCTLSLWKGGTYSVKNVKSKQMSRRRINIKI